MAAMEWGIPLDEWYTHSYEVRCQMMATVIAKGRVETLMIRSRND